MKSKIITFRMLILAAAIGLFLRELVQVLGITWQDLVAPTLLHEYSLLGVAFFAPIVALILVAIGYNTPIAIWRVGVGILEEVEEQLDTSAQGNIKLAISVFLTAWVAKEAALWTGENLQTAWVFGIGETTGAVLLMLMMMGILNAVRTQRRLAFHRRYFAHAQR